MYIAARRKSLPWLLLTVTILLSFLSMIILQGVAAEPAYYPRSLSSFPILPTSWTDNSNGLFGSFDSISFQGHKVTLWQDTVKPGVREAKNNQLTADVTSERANENAVETYAKPADDTISWVLFDSKGRQYYLEVTDDEYSRNVTTLVKPNNIQYLETENNEIISVRDYTKFVQAQPFSRLADEIYENAGSDHQFIYETWYIATNATSYAKEDVEQVNSPLETLFLGKGDCEDLTILIASIMSASSYTKDWEIKIVYFDAFNPETSGTVNHVALYVDTGNESTFVESTTDSKGLTIWNKVDGWYVDV